MIKQSEAVVNAVKEVIGEIDETTPVTLDKDQLTAVRDIVFNGIINGDVVYNKDLDEKKVKTYVNGMVTNHLRKNRTLNGGTTYKPSENGPKRDPQLKELNKLLNSGKYVEGTDEYNAIIEAIDDRKEVIAETKAAKKAATAKVDIDTSVLPPELQHLAQ